MNCDHVEHILEEHGLDGVTASEQRHIDRCPHCQALVLALDSLEASLGALPVRAPRPVRLDADQITTEFDPVDVLTERRLEAARADWFGAIEQVELVPRRRTFGVPQTHEVNQLARLAFGMVAVAAFVAVGLIGAILWHQSRAPGPSSIDATTEAAAPNEGLAVDALERSGDSNPR